MKILVVDDDATVREVLGLMLDLEGYEVPVAADGDEALALLAGADGFVRKPFSPLELLSIVDDGARETT
jgi:CheY-like chemotaxis protein